jgi:hypothetical protein
MLTSLWVKHSLTAYQNGSTLVLFSDLLTYSKVPHLRQWSDQLAQAKSLTLTSNSPDHSASKIHPISIPSPAHLCCVLGHTLLAWTECLLASILPLYTPFHITFSKILLNYKPDLSTPSLKPSTVFASMHEHPCGAVHLSAHLPHCTWHPQSPSCQVTLTLPQPKTISQYLC